MFNYQPFDSQEEAFQEVTTVPEPTIKKIEQTETYGKYSIEPFAKGFGITLANPLRRTLYSSLQGSAITWVKIDQILHEYTTIPNVKEEVNEILLNVQGIRLRTETERPGKLRLDVTGEGTVCAGDIMASADYEIVNPEHHLATLNSDKAKLSIEFNVERGAGYSEKSHRDGLPIGVLPVDAVYSPIKKVNYTIDTIRVGTQTDCEKITIEVWTDGSISAISAIETAASTLVNHFFIFANASKSNEDGIDSGESNLSISPEQFNISVEDLSLSARTLNCLKRTGINKIGDVIEYSEEDLLKIRNFGLKSFNELYDKLQQLNLIPDKWAKESTETGEHNET